MEENIRKKIKGRRKGEGIFVSRHDVMSKNTDRVIMYITLHRNLREFLG